MKFLMRAILRVVLRLLFRVRMHGDVRELSAEKLLIVANHESFLDGVLLAIFLPIDPVFVIHRGVCQNPVFRLVLSQIDYLLVDPTCPMGVKTVIQLINSGRPVVIFPEGRITDTGCLMKVYDGPAFVAVKTRATIVPVRLNGTSRTYFSRLSGEHPRQLFPQITISILEGRQIPYPEDATAKDRHHHAGDAMRRLMQEMLFVTQPISTLFDALCDCANIFGRRRALVEDIKAAYGYGDLIRMSLMLGRLLTRVSVEGERVGVLMPNVAATLGIFFGLSAFRRVPALLNYTSGSDALQSACVATGLRTIISSRAFIAQAELEEKLAKIQSVNIVYLEDIRAWLRIRDKIWWLGFARWLPRKAAVQSRGAEDIAAILFTSGSEGKPKGVALSHRAILSNVAQLRSAVDFSVRDKFFNALPLFHAFGLTAGAMVPVLSGAPLFLYTSPLHYRVIPELAYDRNCTVMLGTSTFLANYAKHAHPYDFFRLRYVISGAEKLSPTTRELWFERFGIRLMEGYGATETGPVLSVNTNMAYRTGSVGQFLPSIDYRVVPIPGIEIGGALHVRGPNVMTGYFHLSNPEELEPVSSELGPGWYNTGDVVAVDSEGFIHILGRVKRFAKIAGEMVSLETVERLALNASPGHVHASTATSDTRRGENLVLFTTDQDLTRERLLVCARQLGIPELAVPKKIVRRQEIPCLGSGKTDYVTLNNITASIVEGLRTPEELAEAEA
jgi:acyl-[acyl-carrier-protein]-phospholipid O-acyltransferase/long-chain-fatty-acid--[acyl-carrier-protein] ligase